MSMLGDDERPRLKLKAKETEGLLEFVREWLETLYILGGLGGVDGARVGRK